MNQKPATKDFGETSTSSVESLSRAARRHEEKRITFTPAEMETLRREAERARETLRAAGIYPKRVYEEERYEFVSEYMRGAINPTLERRKWLRKIKRELAVKERKGRKKNIQIT